MLKSNSWIFVEYIQGSSISEYLKSVSRVQVLYTWIFVEYIQGSNPIPEYL